ncbi:hypothetical protein LZ32DRAFT_265088 [Colletotrichum eremochloae]|nr:hypothetical protein LZ32DRAFT_265088 [Colletotrichum eremochloae]
MGIKLSVPALPTIRPGWCKCSCVFLRPGLLFYKAGNPRLELKKNASGVNCHRSTFTTPNMLVLGRRNCLERGPAVASKPSGWLTCEEILARALFGCICFSFPYYPLFSLAACFLISQKKVPNSSWGFFTTTWTTWTAGGYAVKVLNTYHHQPGIIVKVQLQVRRPSSSQRDTFPSFVLWSLPVFR